MKKIWTGVVLALALFGSAHAQTTRELAFKLAEISVGDSFDSIKPLLAMALDNMEKSAKASGKVDRMLSIFIEEMKNAFNRENFVRVAAELWEREMTRDELQEALNFTTSNTGRKFQRASESMKEPRTLAPIFRDACSRARSRLESIAASTAELDRACTQFQ